MQYIKYPEEYNIMYYENKLIRLIILENVLIILCVIA